jgi:hypothetical protein
MNTGRSYDVSRVVPFEARFVVCPCAGIPHIDQEDTMKTALAIAVLSALLSGQALAGGSTSTSTSTSSAKCDPATGTPSHSTPVTTTKGRTPIVPARTPVPKPKPIPVVVLKPHLPDIPLTPPKHGSPLIPDYHPPMTAVPEPDAVAMMLGGLLVAGGVLARRRRQG